MDYGHYALLLLAVGLAVLVIEVFVPSGGVLAVVTLLCLAASVLCAVWEWWGTNMPAFWAYIAGTLVLIPSTLVGAFVMLPRTKLGRRLLQEPPTPEETASFTRERAELEELVGARGVTVTPCSPGGMVEVDGRRWHAESRGLMLDAGDDIEVTGTRGNRLLVRLADAAPAPPGDDGENGGQAESSPAAPGPVAVEPNPDRPGGSIAPDAPVGYSPPDAADGPPAADPAELADGPDDRPAAAADVADPFAADAEREAGGGNS